MKTTKVTTEKNNRKPICQLRETTWSWLRSEMLKKETEGSSLETQEPGLLTVWKYSHYAINNNKCHLCSEKNFLFIKYIYMAAQLTQDEHNGPLKKQ